jgi:hypothetical protein
MRELERLDIPRAEAEKDILRPTAPSAAPPTSIQAFKDVFKSQYLGRSLLGMFILGMIQLSGIDGVTYVSFFSRPLLC